MCLFPIILGGLFKADTYTKVSGSSANGVVFVAGGDFFDQHFYHRFTLRSEDCGRDEHSGVVITNCLLSFAGIVFFSLSMVERYCEIAKLKDGQERMEGRGYLKIDAPVVLTMSIGSGFISCFVLALYVSLPLVKYSFAHLFRITVLNK
jgi:hypothetical protein